MTSTIRQAKAVGSVLAGSRNYEPSTSAIATTPGTESNFGQGGIPSVRLVLVHGSMDRQSGFLKLAKILGQDHSVVVYDRRGYASSLDLGGPYGIDQHVRDLVEVIGSTPTILVGHSFGGTVALACAARHPDIVRGVVTYENPMPWLEWWPRDTGAGNAARRSADPEGAAEDFLKRFIGQRLWDRLPESTKVLRRREGRALVDELASIHSGPVFARESLRVPIVVGVGSLAKEYMRRGAEYLSELDDSRLVVLEGAHHNAHSARAPEFADRVVRPLVERVEFARWTLLE